ncbi:carboxymuconolactone decarboxylase family protein [Seohaeicola zhoushanensis]
MTQRLDYYGKAPDAAKKYLAFSQAVHGGELDDILRELVNLRASQMNGCAFCTDMHVKGARLAGSVNCACITSRSGANRRCSTNGNAPRWNGPRR